MKIGLVYEDLVVRGGGQRLLLTQAKLLQEAGYDVTVFTPAYSRDVYSSLVKLLDVKVVPPPRASMLSRFPVLSQTIREIAIVSQWCPADLARQDLVIGYTFPSNIAAYHAHSKWRVPIVWHCTHPAYWMYPRSKEDRGSNPKTRALQDMLRVPLASLERRASRAFSRILVISSKIGRRVESIYGLPSTVLSPCVDSGDFNYDSQILEEQHSILYVGRLLWNKGPDLFLQMLREVVAEIPDAKGIMAIAGQGTRLQSLEMFRQSIQRLGLQENVELITSLDGGGLDIGRLYRRSSVVAYTCRDEDFGLVPLEAGLCGRPSVLWDNCGCVEDQILVDGKSAQVIPHYYVDKFAKEVAELLRNPSLRQRLSANARMSVFQRCSPQAHTSRLEEVINESVELSRRP